MAQAQKDWNDYEPVSNVNYSKRKQVTQRMNVKKCTIMENEKAIARLPSYYKFNRSTTEILQMLIDQGLAGELHNVVGKGSNTTVIHAHCGGHLHLYFPNGNAIKVYRLSNSVEKNNAIYQRVDKENKHLKILEMNYYSNNTPYPVYKYKNIIVMSFIGIEQESVPSIATVPSDMLIDTYNGIVKEIEMWYRKLGLVHGSLSSSKILRTNTLYFIGWSHSVKRDHPMALKKLMKDCQFVSRFFHSRGASVKSAEELFKEITGLSKISSKVLEVVQKDLWNNPQAPNPNIKSTQDFRTTPNRFK